MTTRQEIESAFKTRLKLTDTSTRFSATEINNFTNRAYLLVLKAFGYKAREKSMKTTTVASQYYYDDPIEMPAGGITRLTVAGAEYKKLDFADWVDYVEDTNKDSTKKYFSQYGNQFFLHPTPTVDDIDIVIWGEIQSPKLTADSSETVFTGSDEEMNEAILQMMLYLADLDTTAREEAMQIIEKYKRMKNGYAQRERLIKSVQFNVPDYYG